MSDGNTSTVILVLKNSSLDDGDLLSSAISQTLREYCDMVDHCEAGNEPQESFSGSNGTELTIMAVSSPVACIPQLPPLKRLRQAVEEMREQ